MITPRSSRRFQRAFTLLEMTIVIMVLLALMKIGLFTSTKMDEWKLGRTASETLRGVYAAQRMYFAARFCFESAEEPGNRQARSTALMTT